MSDPNTGNLTPHAYAASHPPLPDGPKMSTVETLTSIFFEPGRTFDSLRAHPRFLAAAAITAVLTCVFTFVFFQRAGYENVMRAAIENSPRGDRMTHEQKEQAIGFYVNPAVKAAFYLSPLIGVLMVYAAGSALYLLGVMLMGRSITYFQALSVWAYSSFAPNLLTILVSFILLFLKSKEELETMQPGRSLARANLGILVDPKATPVLAAVLGSFDIFTFYGLFLAALGLRQVARLSSGAAWGIVLGLWLVGIIFKVALAAVTGTVI
ncbi:MAG TPA: YIP1 family protein [Pyrinomonadaceae bacterium]